MDRSKLIERGRKLARLADPASNPNPHEVETARAKLREFLEKNDLTYDELGLFTLFRKPFEPLITKMWEKQLIFAIALTFGVQFVSYTNDDHVLMGEENSVKTVETMYDYLTSIIKRLVNAYLTRFPDHVYQPHKNASRNSYCIGATFSVCETLELMRKSRKSSSNADDLWAAMGDIDKTKEVINEEFGKPLAQENLEFEDFTIKDMTAYDYGRAEGEKIQINLLAEK